MAAAKLNRLRILAEIATILTPEIFSCEDSRITWFKRLLAPLVERRHVSDTPWTACLHFFCIHFPTLATDTNDRLPDLAPPACRDTTKPLKQ
jgi:hypothetical protein